MRSPNRPLQVPTLNNPPTATLTLPSRAQRASSTSHRSPNLSPSLHSIAFTGTSPITKPSLQRPSIEPSSALHRTTKPSLHRPSIDQAKPSSAFYRTTKPSLHRPSIESPNQAFSGLPSSLQRPSIEQPSQAFIGTPSSHCRHPNASSVLIPLHVFVNT